MGFGSRLCAPAAVAVCFVHLGMRLCLMLNFGCVAPPVVHATVYPVLLVRPSGR